MYALRAVRKHFEHGNLVVKNNSILRLNPKTVITFLRLIIDYFYVIVENIMLLINISRQMLISIDRKSFKMLYSDKIYSYLVKAHVNFYYLVGTLNFTVL